MLPSEVPDAVLMRVLANVTVREDGCVISNYSVGSHGYAQLGWWKTGRVCCMILAHRAAWLALRGPIPDDMTIDHICRVRKCVNVAHLRLLTNVENARSNGNAIKTHCPRDHPYDAENTRRDSRGFRYCKQCARDRRKARRTQL